MKIRNHRAVVAATVSVVAVCGLVATGVAAQTPDNEDHVISVSFEPRESVGEGCATQAAGLSMKSEESADSFSYIFTVKTELCDPVDAWAASYQMPSSTWPWPQTFVKKTEKITLGDAGVTTVTFSKECTPLQFDVLAGSSTPTQIGPFGAHHSDLLFPANFKWSWPNLADFSGASAHQYFPTNPDCFPTSSTTSSTIAPASSTTPTSVPPVTVSPETTIQENSGGPGPSAGPSGGAQPAATVGGVQATQSPARLSISG